MTTQTTAFDQACGEFTTACRKAADWKQVYFGAAYSTRLKAACNELEEAIRDMRGAIQRDKA